MPKPVLIILAAVILLIAVVWYLGMRYLRSDDEGEFDDVAAEHGPGRDGQRGRRNDHHYDDDLTELVPAGGRIARSQAGARRTAAGPGNGSSSRPPSRDRDSRDYGDGGRDFGRDSRDPRRDSRATRSAPAVRELAVADLDALDRRDGARPGSKPDARKGGHGPGDQQHDILPPVKPRQSKSKSKRDDDGDWPRNEWDDLSDVDYWTELAADKPFTADAADTRAGRPQPAAARGTGREEPTKLLDQPLLPPAGRPVRRNHEDRRSASGSRPASSSRTERMDTTRSAPGRSEPARPESRPESRPARTTHKTPVAAEFASGVSRSAAPLDDDPLTSPSFPRVAADDSRSYHRGRPNAHDRAVAGSATEYAAAPTSYDQPAQAYGGADAYRVPAASHGGSVPESSLYSSPQYSTAQYSTAQYSTAQPSAPQPSAPQYSAPQYSAPAGHSYPAYPDGAAADPGYSPGHYEQSWPGHQVPASYDALAAGYGSLPPSYDTSYDNGPSGYVSDPASYGTGHNGAGYDGAGQYGASHYDAGSYGTEPGYADPLTSPYPYQAGVPQSYATPSVPYQYPAASAQPGDHGGPEGYAGADPYAVDPHGYSGYGDRSY